MPCWEMPRRHEKSSAGCHEQHLRSWLLKWYGRSWSWRSMKRCARKRACGSGIIMNKMDKIYVAGHRGMVGSAVVRRLRSAGFENLVTRSHEELDLTDQEAVAAFFATERPHHVVLAAAKVGGILANARFSAE